MSHTIQMKDCIEPIRLENNPINNRDGKVWISLKTVKVWVGYCNVRKRERIFMQRMSKGGDIIDNFQFIEPVLCSIKQINDIVVLNNIPWTGLNINEKSVEFTLVIEKERNKIKFPPEIAKLLGLRNGLLSMGKYKGIFYSVQFQFQFIFHSIGTQQN